MDVLHSPITWIIVAAISEIIALNPKLKSNSIIQLMLAAIQSLKPAKKS